MKIITESIGVPIPRAKIYGYGRKQVFSYTCYGCRDQFFETSDSNWDKILCVKCEGKIGEISVPCSEVAQIEIIGFKQMVAGHCIRTKQFSPTILKRDNYICQYCGYNPRHSSKIIALHIDHIIPASANGSNSKNNLVTSCQWCNARVGNLLFKSFLDKKIYIVELRRKAKLPVGEQEWKACATAE